MQQKPMSLMEFQRKFSTEKSRRQHLFRLRWPGGYQCPRCGHPKYSFHGTRHLYQCKSCKYQVSVTAGTIFHKTRTPLRKWFWMIFLMAPQKSGISMLSLQRMLGIKSYKTVWVMGHKIRKAMAHRDAYYRLAGLIEMDDTYFGSSKPGKRGRGAGGKATVVVAVEIEDSKPRFATMRQVGRLSAAEIHSAFAEHLQQDWVVHTDGWPSYGIFDSAKVSTSLWLPVLGEMR